MDVGCRLDRMVETLYEGAGVAGVRVPARVPTPTLDTESLGKMDEGMLRAMLLARCGC